jgi:hypothetical protein
MAENNDMFVDMVRPDSGCALANDMGFSMFIELFNRTHNNPCDGCSYHSGCEFLRKQSGASRSRRLRGFFGQHSHETNAKIAKRKGISKRQVTKMRKRGEL